jgi:hypothetical protein
MIEITRRPTLLVVSHHLEGIGAAIGAGAYLDFS